MSDTADAPAPTIRSLGVAVYAPAFLFSVGQGAVIPIIALTALDLGASIAVAGAAVAMRGVGIIAFDLPAGKLVARVGDRGAMMFATALLVASLLGCIASPEPISFAVCMFLMGCSWSIWMLARLAYVSDVMPPKLRGRALSTLGGVNRMGNFVGPFLGAAVIHLSGVDGAYILHVVFGLAGLAVLFRGPDPRAQPTGGRDESIGSVHMARMHAPVLRTAGLAAMTISILRAARQVVLPLWAAHLGMDAATVGVVFGISAAMDMTLFYPAGAVSDRWGRKAVAVPCLATMAMGFALIPLTSSLTGLVAVGVLLGFGNGIGSGIIMTLGTDLSPARGRVEFLGVWRLVSDAGTMVGPLLVAGVEVVGGLGAASLVVAALGVAGAAFVWRVVPETLVLDRNRSS